jgi:hypothetical protein
MDDAIAVSLSTSLSHPNSRCRSPSQIDTGGGAVDLSGRAGGEVAKDEIQELSLCLCSHKHSANNGLDQGQEYRG